MMTKALLVSLVASLLLTLLLESGFYFLVGKREKKDYLLLLLVNIITNPVVVLSYWLLALYTTWNLNLVIVPLELCAVVVEGIYYKKYSRELNRPYLFSLCANSFSYGVGALLQILL